MPLSLKDQIRARYEEAKLALPKNVCRLPLFDRPVLTPGNGYPGIYLEHNLDNVFYTTIDPEVAIAGHDIFFEFQREDGLFPSAVLDTSRAQHPTGIIYQSVHVLSSLAFTAWEIAQRTQREDFLSRAYKACVRYDDWLTKNRDRRGTGLVEMYCEYDTGHDQSPRVKDGGIPPTCPKANAVEMPDLDFMPIIAPDLSAMLYDGRVYLGKMADALDKTAEAETWRQRASETRQRIHDICFDPVDEFFYDVDSKGRFRKYRTEHITRMFMNGTVDQALFDRIYTRYFQDPKEFATPFPFPSISLSDPAHDHRYPNNSWGGQSQALTAQRTILWMAKYGRLTDFKALAQTWVNSLATSEKPFMQEMNPVTGVFSDSCPYYTPSLLMMIDFTDWLEGRPSITQTFLDQAQTSLLLTRSS